MSPHAAPPALLSNPIHENGTFRGWPRPITSSVPKNHPFSGLARHLPQDLPCQKPFSRKVLPFSGGPSMQEAIFPEGSCVFQGDLPRWRPFPWKVLRFFGGPSMLGAVFLEGPAFFRGTFHARSHFPGRSCAFPGDLPCQRPFSRKVLHFPGGPSMLEAIFPEGPCPSALSLRYFGTPGTKNARFAPGLHYFGTSGAVRPLIQERQRRSRST